MSEFIVRPLVEGEQRAAHAVLATALHKVVLDDEGWELVRPSFPAERKIGAFAGDEPVGIASSFASELVVPGGASVSMAAVNGVAVRADWTRRGVMSSMMAAQLPDLVARGHIVAGLHASEATIYGRFGYGVGTSVKSVRVTRSAARWRPEVPASGQVRLVDRATAAKRLAELYPRSGGGPGTMTRPAVWWPDFGRQGIHVAVHSDAGGGDGYVAYSIRESTQGTQLDVGELRAATDEARASLWRFVLGVDLVADVYAKIRPVDEPVGEFLLDPRACRTTSVGDDLWLRLLDVEAALTARSYRAADPVVVEVVDVSLPANSGKYLIGPLGAERTNSDAQVRLDVDALAMLYLGDCRATTLVRTGRAEAVDQAAPARLDELFRTEERPWCGTNF
jgi:predicted acetyltransferase